MKQKAEALREYSKVFVYFGHSIFRWYFDDSVRC